MTPLAILAVVALWGVSAYAFVVLFGIASRDDTDDPPAPRHLDTGDPEQRRNPYPSPDWLRQKYVPRHLAAEGVTA